MKIIFALLAASTGVARSDAVPSPKDILSQMTVDEKIGQMTQLDISYFKNAQPLKLGQPFVLDQTKLEQTFDQYKIGSVINTMYTGVDLCDDSVGNASAGWSVAEWRSIISTVQDASRKSQSADKTFIPVLYGLDSVHGANYVPGSAIFPHNTGVAATFDPTCAAAAGRRAAEDTRAAGIPWMFSPVLGAGVQPLWPRLYETFGEDPLVGSTMGAAFIASAQSTGLNSSDSVAATAKHLMGYSAPRSGKDRTDAWLPEPYLRQYFVPAFQAAFDAGAKTIMINSASINGMPVHASKPILTSLVREQMGFGDGLAVTDWQDIEKLHFYHHLAATNAEAISLALDAGVDMSMVPLDLSFYTTLQAMVKNGTVPESRLDESVMRILSAKAELGLFQNPVAPPGADEHTPGSPAAELEALETARRSITLIKNEALPSNATVASGRKAPDTLATSQQATLPLDWLPSKAKVLVTGPAAASRSAMCGGWTFHWLGACPSDVEFAGRGQLVQESLQQLLPAAGVQYVPGADFDKPIPGGLEQASAAAADSDVIILAVGEPPESESEGDTNSLLLSDSQMALYDAVAAAGKPIVLLLIEPRPRILGRVADGSSAIVMAYLPCYHGGQAIGEALVGLFSPSGRLPIEYPASSGDIDVYYRKPTSDYSQGTSSPTHSPLAGFGHGLTYGNITVDELTLSANVVGPNDTVQATVKLTNRGKHATNFTLLAFGSQLYRARITPEVEMLRAFKRVDAISPGQSITAAVPVKMSQFAYWDFQAAFRVDAGDFIIRVEDKVANVHITEELIIRQDTPIGMG